MAELFGIVITIKNPEPLEIKYDYISGLWVRTDEDKHIGLNTLTHYILPNVELVHFGQASFTLQEWRAAGSPIVLSPNEVALLQRVINHAHQVEGRI